MVLRSQRLISMALRETAMSQVVYYANDDDFGVGRVGGFQDFYQLTDDLNVSFMVGIRGTDDIYGDVWVPAMCLSPWAYLIAYVGMFEIFRVHIGEQTSIIAPSLERASNLGTAQALSLYWGTLVYTDGEYLFKKNARRGMWYTAAMVNRIGVLLEEDNEPTISW